MPVKHQFVSAKSDRGDATLVRPSDWNADHAGNPILGLIVAATNSATKDKNGADYLCDGTADDSEIQAAIDALEAAGGGVLWLAAGTYTLAAALDFSTNVRIVVVGYGARLTVPASTNGIVVTQGNVSGVRGIRLEGLIVDGLSNSSTNGIVLRDTNNAELVKVDIEACTTGLRFHSNAASAFVEGTQIDNLLIRNCTTGWTSEITSGTGSFAQTVARGVKITGCTTGINFVNGSILQRSHIEATVWIASSQTACTLDCNVEDLALDLAVEGAGGSTGNVAFVMGSNATNTKTIHFRFWPTGTINTQITTNSKDFWYWVEGAILASSQGTATFGMRRHGDSNDRLRFDALTAGGSLLGGSGSAAPDVNLYRSAANIWSSDDKIDPASLNLQLKAGAVVDGDIVGGAASGDVAFDTTNHRLYIRSGTTWRFIEFVQPFARGGTLFNSAGIPNTAVNLIVWRAPFDCTVTNVRGYRVGGTGATINARRNGTSNHLSSALSLTSADTWQDGGAVQNTTYAAGDKLEIMIVTTAGTVTQLAIQVDFTRP